MSEHSAAFYNDPTVAGDYSRVRVPFSEDPAFDSIDRFSKSKVWAHELFYEQVSYHDASDKRLVEVGCGNGRWAITAAPEVGYKTIGVDLSRSMLSTARENERKSGERFCYDPSRDIAWVQATAWELPLEDNSVDIVLLSHVHHFFKKKAPAVFREFSRVLRVGGLVIDRFQPREDLGDDFEHSHSLALTKIDNTRIPTRDTAEGWARAAGLEVDSVRLARMYFSRDPIGYRINRFESRVVSSVRALGKAAHRAALQEMQDVADKQTVKTVCDQPVTTMTLLRETGWGQTRPSHVTEIATGEAGHKLTSEQIKAMTDYYTIMYARKVA